MFASKRFGFPLFSPSIKAERITSISAPNCGICTVVRGFAG
jgi:hypothetical protein